MRVSVLRGAVLGELKNFYLDTVRAPPLVLAGVQEGAQAPSHHGIASLHPLVVLQQTFEYY